MTFSKYLKTINLWVILLLVLSVIVAMIISITAFNHFIFREKSGKDSAIIAPYYDKSAFQLPSDLKRSNSSSEDGQLKISIKIPVIMYHYVEYVQDAGDLIRKKLNINPDIFEAELKAISESRYVTAFVKDIPDMLLEKTTPINPPIILTFDDGYEDFYTFAFPLLKKYQLKSTIYVVNDFIGKKGYLTEKEIWEIIASNLVEIGAHTLDHVSLKKTSFQLAKKQIFDSKKRLEDKFGLDVKTFAYPYGAFDNQALDLVKEASFSAAVSVIPGTFQSEDNLFYLSRIRSGTFSGKNIIKILESMKK